MASNLEERQGEAALAELLIKGEADKSLRSLRGRDVVPSIVALRLQVEAMSRTELERALRKLPHAPRETRAAFEALVTGIVNKILHPPTVKLREAAGAGAGREWAEVVSQLFALSPTCLSGRTARATDRCGRSKRIRAHHGSRAVTTLRAGISRPRWFRPPAGTPWRQQ